MLCTRRRIRSPPQSAIMMVRCGPGRKLDRSRTRIPSSFMRKCLRVSKRMRRLAVQPNRERRAIVACTSLRSCPLFCVYAMKRTSSQPANATLPQLRAFCRCPVRRRGVRWSTGNTLRSPESDMRRVLRIGWPIAALTVRPIRPSKPPCRSATRSTNGARSPRQPASRSNRRPEFLRANGGEAAINQGGI